ncbi:MAG TPA: hypothetical protein VFG21_05550 [Xanthomonadaceae bacterium]|nr:hypothetical protein [Xanthomonadaceae bacterium]
MKTIMMSTRVVRVPVLLLALACAGAVAAQDQMNPRDQVNPEVRTQSCAQVDIDWNLELISQYPRIPDACHEVVTSNGVKWARFEANFVRVNQDGSVTSDFHAPNGRSVGRFTLMPAPGQMVTLSGRKVEFSSLRPNQQLSMYVPEGATGLSFEPGVPPQQHGRFVRYEEPTPEPVQFARADPEPRYDTRLPDTAGPLPWFALGGVLSLLGAVGLRVGRRNR